MLTKEITNERDYRIAHAEADRLATLLARQDRETSHMSPQERTMMHDATAARLEELGIGSPHMRPGASPVAR